MMDDFAGYVVVNDCQPFEVEKWRQDSAYQATRLFTSIWADQRLAQMVANVANALNPDLLKDFVIVIENL